VPSIKAVQGNGTLLWRSQSTDCNHASHRFRYGFLSPAFDAKAVRLAFLYQIQQADMREFCYEFGVDNTPLNQYWIQL